MLICCTLSLQTRNSPSSLMPSSRTPRSLFPPSLRLPLLVTGYLGISAGGNCVRQTEVFQVLRVRMVGVDMRGDLCIGATKERGKNQGGEILAHRNINCPFLCGLT